METKRLTLEEFLNLPRGLQNERYTELSDRDKFLARTSDWGSEPGAPKASSESIKETPPSGWEFLPRYLEENFDENGKRIQKKAPE